MMCSDCKAEIDRVDIDADSWVIAELDGEHMNRVEEITYYELTELRIKCQECRKAGLSKFVKISPEFLRKIVSKLMPEIRADLENIPQTC